MAGKIHLFLRILNQEVVYRRFLEFAEAWSWTYLLMQRVPGGREIIRQYLAALRDDQAPGDLAGQLPGLLGSPLTLWQREFAD